MLQKKRALHEGLLIRLGKRESESRGGEEDHFEEILKLSLKHSYELIPKYLPVDVIGTRFQWSMGEQTLLYLFIDDFTLLFLIIS